MSIALLHYHATMLLYRPTSDKDASKCRIPLRQLCRREVPHVQDSNRLDLVVSDQRPACFAPHEHMPLSECFSKRGHDIKSTRRDLSATRLDAYDLASDMYRDMLLMRI